MGLAGCGAPAVPTAEVEKAVLSECNRQLSLKNAGTCTSAQLVQQTSNVYVGFVRFADGGQRSVTITTDRSTGRMDVDWGKMERSAP
jgi:hypothetical protein